MWLTTSTSSLLPKLNWIWPHSGIELKGSPRKRSKCHPKLKPELWFVSFTKGNSWNLFNHFSQILRIILFYYYFFHSLQDLNTPHQTHRNRLPSLTNTFNSRAVLWHFSMSLLCDPGVPSQPHWVELLTFVSFAIPFEVEKNWNSIKRLLTCSLSEAGAQHSQFLWLIYGIKQQ